MSLLEDITLIRNAAKTGTGQWEAYKAVDPYQEFFELGFCDN